MPDCSSVISSLGKAVLLGNLDVRSRLKVQLSLLSMVTG